MSKFNDESAPNKKYNPKKRQMREIEFINIHITSEQEKDLATLRDSLAKMQINPLDTLTMAGYKVSINVDFENECYIVSVTGGERTVNVDKCVSSRSDDLDECILMAYFKTFDKNGAIVWESKPKRFNWG